MISNNNGLRQHYFGRRGECANYIPFSRANVQVPSSENRPHHSICVSCHGKALEFNKSLIDYDTQVSAIPVGLAGGKSVALFAFIFYISSGARISRAKEHELGDNIHMSTKGET